MANLHMNIKIVKDLYDALGRGDIPEVLTLIDDDVDWRSPATNTTVKEIPWSKPRRSRSEVSAFLKEISDKITMDDMSYSNITAQDDRVIAEGTTRGTVLSSGCFYRSDWVMVFTLRNGRIVRFRHYYDSADVAAAFHGKGDECKAVLRAAA